MTFRTLSFDTKVRVAGGRGYADFLRRTRQADRSDREALVELQAESAAAMVRYAIERSPWYRERLAGADVDRLHDPSVFETLPMLEKAELRDNFDQLVASGDPVRRTKVATTGGSTGLPLKVVKDFTVRPATLTWRLMRWWGVGPADNSASIERLPWGGWRHRANEALWWPTRKVNVDAAAMDEEDMHRFALAMDRIQPRMLWGYAGALHQFALTAERLSWPLPRLTAISSSAAPLTAVQTVEIERILGAPVHQTYRAAELSLIAGHCELRQGLHIQSDHKLVEIVDDDGRRVPDGEPGEVVVTDLMNHAQPLIRYRLGDIATMSPDPCPCGRPFPVLASLHGRTNDMIRTREGVVSAYTFASAFAGHPSVRQYQIHQLADYSLVVKIVLGADVQPVELDDVVRHLTAEMRGSLPVSIELVDEIPHLRGKHKSVVSHLEIP